MDGDSNEQALLITNIVTLLLWVVSEILALSKCKPNSIIQCFFHNPCWDGEVEVDVELTPAIITPTALPTDPT
jgi:hypothetical protein